MNLNASTKGTYNKSRHQRDHERLSVTPSTPTGRLTRIIHMRASTESFVHLPAWWRTKGVIEARTAPFPL